MKAGLLAADNKTSSRLVQTSVVRIASLIVLLFSGSALVLFAGMDRSVNVYDEGIILVGAGRVLAGDVIHRDFYANYGPGQFYVLSRLFSLFPPTVLVERGWDVAIRAGTTVLCYLIGTQLAGRFFAGLAYLLSLIWLVSAGFYGYPVYPALLFTLLSFYFLLLLYQGAAGRSAILPAGAAAGIVVLFRYDLGVSVAVAELLVGSGFFLLQPGRSLSDRGGLLIGFLVLYAMGFAIPVVPLGIAYVLSGAAKDFWFDVVNFTMNHYVYTRSLPFPAISFTNLPALYSTAVYLPIAIWLAALVCLLGSRGRPGSIIASWYGDRSWATLQLLVLSISLFLKGIVRLATASVTIAIVSSVVLLAVIAGPQLAKGRIARAAVVLCVLLTGCFTVAPLRLALSQTAANFRWASDGLNDGSCHPPAGLERLTCLAIGKDIADAVQYVQAITTPEDYLFVGAGRHDKIFVNNILFYFLTNRRPATKWYHFDPGLQTSAAIQREMIAELEAKRPPVVVLDRGFDAIQEPNASSESSHIVLLDDYLQTHYREQRRFGDFISVLTRITER